MSFQSKSSELLFIEFGRLGLGLICDKDLRKLEMVVIKGRQTDIPYRHDRYEHLSYHYDPGYSGAQSRMGLSPRLAREA